jgi:hypothetical protein
MGLNIVVGCKRHQERYWLFRGHEDHGVAAFYRKHWDCAGDHPDNVVISDDQADYDWVSNDEWTVFNVHVTASTAIERPA